MSQRTILWTGKSDLRLIGLEKSICSNVSRRFASTVIVTEQSNWWWHNREIREEQGVVGAKNWRKNQVRTRKEKKAQSTNPLKQARATKKGNRKRPKSSMNVWSVLTLQRLFILNSKDTWDMAFETFQLATSVNCLFLLRLPNTNVRLSRARGKPSVGRGAKVPSD